MHPVPALWILALVSLAMAGCTDSDDASDAAGESGPGGQQPGAVGGPASGGSPALGLDRRLEMPDGLEPWGFVVDAQFIDEGNCEVSWSASGAFDDHPAHMINIMVAPGVSGAAIITPGQSGHAEEYRLELLPSGILGWTAEGGGTLAGAAGQAAYWIVGLAGGSDDAEPQTFTGDVACDAAANATVRFGVPTLVVPGSLQEGDAFSASTSASPIGYGDESVELPAPDGLVVVVHGSPRNATGEEARVRLDGDPADAWELGDEGAFWRRGPGTYTLASTFTNADGTSLHGVALRIEA